MLAGNKAAPLEALTNASKARRLMWIQFFLVGAGLLGAFFKTEVGITLPFEILGIILLLPGVLIFVISVKSLGRSLTPDPVPKSEAILVTTGAYRFVRHPIYVALISLAFGWAFLFSSLISFICSVCLYLVLNKKASYEEAFLLAKFPDYKNYCAKVGRFLPRTLIFTRLP